MLLVQNIGLVIVLSVFQVQCRREDVIINTPLGRIRGSTAQTRKGRNIFSFYGIRYGEPPIGKNRFNPPVPVTSWNDIYNANQTGQACMQSNPTSTYTVSEDCLFLDLYTPDLRHPKPVMVFIHGGGFSTGAKSDASPDYLLDTDIVLVSINYRLGPFGFFSTGTKHASGNLAFKDQNLALKWVRNNIKPFGGDPDSVTLCGHSAGSYSVTAHLVSPMSKGLVHRAIVMSGSILSYLNSTVRNSSAIVLNEVGCSLDDLSESMKCIRNIPAENILAASQRIQSILPWYYDIESDSSDEPFFNDVPMNIARNGGLQIVPLITGVNTDEFLNIANDMISKNTPGIDWLNKDFNNAAASMFYYNDNARANEISETLRSFYFQDQPLTMTNINSLGEIFSDLLFGQGVHQLVEMERQHTKVYYYHFEYQGKYSHAYKEDGSPLGIIHGDELQYIFVFKKIAPILSETDPENEMIERMTRWWAQFAKTGNPNNSRMNSTNDVIWVPSDRNKIQSIRINVTCRMLPEHNVRRYALLDTCFPL